MPSGSNGSNNNGGSNGPINGDILNALSGDVTLIRGDTSAIRDNTDILATMNQNIAAILQGVGRWSQQDARSRIYDTSNNGRTGQSGPYNRGNGTQTNPANSRNTNRVDANPQNFIDSFFDELEKQMFGSGFKNAMQQNMKEFAAAMGLQVQDLPSAFGKALAQQLQQTKLAKGLSDKLNSTMDKLWDSSMARMRKGINDYYVRRNDPSNPNFDPSNIQDGADQLARWNEVLDRMTENFRNRRTTPTNDPTPGGSDDPGNPPNPNPPDANPPDESTKKILEDKLQYLYPIHNTLNSINEGIKIIADGLGGSADDVSRYDELFKRNNEENENFINDLLSQGQGGADNLIDSLLGDAGVQGALNDLTGALGGGALDVGAGMAGLVSAALPVAAGFLAVNAALWLVDKALDAFAACFKPLQESFKELQNTLHTTINRYFESERAKIKKQTDRLTEDVNTLIKKPFEIMEAAAQDWYSAWDNNLKTINATQGYTKADLQSLMSGYAERLRSENLASTVSAADISNNLAKVLESGMSGKVAEEFAYLATVLNNAIPTQDFFGYASTYASIAANQIALGKSQADAISAANDQLTQFASSLLYSSRELTGGFSTGLSNASELLTNAVKIANTAGVGNSTYISATLAAVSSIVGAIAPDLAGSITDAIVDAALGGNSDALVALRSLADTGASNTAFLNAFARDPKGVLTTLFKNLSDMQNINTDNFMEVAESLASTFGLSIGALTRVDFASLAESVSNIDVTMKSLDQNMKLLQEGQTTTNAEQLKMNQVNEMILNEGLSYVLDNEAARAIQQHMWDQELAAEMQEATYGVELQGKALEFLSSIAETINNILNFLNPFSWVGKIFTITDTANEVKALTKDLKRVLEAGKVGQGNSESLYNLTTYDVDKLTNKPGNLAEMMGLRSAFRDALNTTSIHRALFGNITTGGGIVGLWNAIFGSSSPSFRQTPGSTVASQYNFATKGLYNALNNTSFATKSKSSNAANIQATTLSSTQTQIDNKASSNLQAFLDTMQEYVEEDKSYKEWVATSQGFGIAKLDQTLADYGITIAELQSKYQEYQAAKSTEYDYNRDQREDQLWDRLQEFMNEDMSQFFEDVTSRMDTQIELLTNIDTTLSNFFTSWTNDWLIQGWNANWLNGAWRQEWINGAWGNDWLATAWRQEWIADAWKNQWLESAWKQEWLQKHWQTNWIDNAWQSNWIDKAWREEWLNGAWRDEWINQAWKTDWIQDAWNNGFILMWRQEWLEKAWKQSWLEKSWGKDWLEKAWSTNWLEQAWNEQWINQAWGKDWLEQAWKKDWLDDAWSSSWLEDAWGEQWLKEAWSNSWLEKAWGTDWMRDAWQENWINQTFNREFVNDTIKMLWGNRWWEFFNIFRDRFGGITTEYTADGTSGKTTIDTKGLYQIYTKETGKAASNALKEVEQTDETGDAILALVKQLTKNTVDLRDPQVQTNVLLGQILIVLEAIMQAENTSGGASLATTLAALGMGMTQPNVTPGMTTGAVAL